MEIPGSLSYKMDTAHLYFTPSHEWVCFEGYLAYVGVSPLKLKNVPQIERIDFPGSSNLIYKDLLLARIYTGGKTCDVMMPMTGRIELFNEALIYGDPGMLKATWTTAWIASFTPMNIHEKDFLISADQYFNHYKIKQ